MKNFRTLRSLSILSAFALVSTLFVFQSCEKDVDPVDERVATQTIEFSVVDATTQNALSGVTATLTFGDASSKVVDIENGTGSLEVSEFPDGDCVVEFEKDGYISLTQTSAINRSGLGEKDDWVSVLNVMISQANDAFAVVSGVEKTVDVQGSDASVVFPANCLTTNAQVAITELPSATSLASSNIPVEIVAERIPLKTFDFQPDGQQFEEPIAVTFEIPDVADELLFGSLVNGEWENVTVTKNGDGTGTAMVSHFSKHSLFVNEKWTKTEERIEWGPFNGPCGGKANPKLKVEPTDSTDPILEVNNSYTEIENIYYVVNASYTQVTKTSSKGKVKKHGIGPVVWSYETVECNPQDHTGGTGN